MQGGQCFSSTKMPTCGIGVREKENRKGNSDVLKPQSERTQANSATEECILTQTLRIFAFPRIIQVLCSLPEERWPEVRRALLTACGFEQEPG